MKKINYIKIKSGRISNQAYEYCKFPSIHNTSSISTPAICTWGVELAGDLTYIAKEILRYHEKNRN